MEDYQAAFFERHTDTEILYRKELERRVAAMHFGGITIECLLKAIICNTLPGGANQTLITHSYTELLKKHNKLKCRVDNNLQVRKWLYQVENPIGQHFIDMRYSSLKPEALNEQNYKDWLYAYQSLITWLHKQITQL
ncbi:hypothetical protein [Sphaerospermopsis torques-reginae]|uniref:HEPN domain-containing protein n=1 Tax=Sphaerospermopsis torques-reginae ITEP-024 TaxID=984208 RepID=A0ABX8WV08_9CYAN|nr:hypothetical protein [Sphaerospermopsis torques-reginae]QYX30259.1 hypothetical protein K2F26_15090 [Sphaerospermopsis torques-reginae ITEP-024]